MRFHLLTPLAALLLASCSMMQPKAAPPKTTDEWRTLARDLPLPQARSLAAKKLPKTVPLKTGEALAAFYFVHSSNPQNYEFYPLNDEALLMLQVGYKQEPEKLGPAAPGGGTGELEPALDAMDGVKQLKTTPTKEDLVVSAQIVLKKEIRFLGISSRSEQSLAEAAGKPKKKK